MGSDLGSELVITRTSKCFEFVVVSSSSSVGGGGGGSSGSIGGSSSSVGCGGSSSAGLLSLGRILRAEVGKVWKKAIMVCFVIFIWRD